MPSMRMMTAARNRGICLPLRYGRVASRSHTILLEKMSIITRRSLAYKSRSSVARVATGLPLPIVMTFH